MTVSPNPLSLLQAFVASARLLLILLGFGLLVYGPFLVYAMIDPGWQEPPFLLPLAMAVANACAFRYVLRATLVRHGMRWRDLGDWRLGSWAVVASFLLMTLGAILIISELDNLLGSVWPPDGRHDGLMGRVMAEPIAALLLVVFVAPITEELFFRGWMLPRLAQSGSHSRAIVISALLFGAIHLNPSQFVSAFCGGLLLGWVMLRTRSIGLCVLGHATNNGIVLLAAHLPFTIQGFTSNRDIAVEHQPWWLTGFGLLALTLGAWTFHRATTPPLPKVRPATFAETPVAVGD